MAIRWRPLRKRRCVKEILHAYAATSEKGRCEEAAHYVLQLARHQDPKARYWLLRPHPDCGPIGKTRLLAKVPKPMRWTYHVCVETARHCVCALTGVDGTLRKDYIVTHFQHGDDGGVHHMPVGEPRDLDERISEITRLR